MRLVPCPTCLRDADWLGSTPRQRPQCAEGWHWVGWAAPPEQLPAMVEACRALPGVARLRYAYTPIGAQRGVELWFAWGASGQETGAWWEMMRAYDRAAHPERYCVECQGRLAADRHRQPYTVCLNPACPQSPLRR